VTTTEVPNDWETLSENIESSKHQDTPIYEIDLAKPEKTFQIIANTFQLITKYCDVCNSHHPTAKLSKKKEQVLLDKALH